MANSPHPALSSKRSPPSVTANQVQRDAVCSAMAAAGTARLVLVRAPAGFGKTTTMVQARERLAGNGTHTAWLTLDRADNDVPRFLACLHQALGPGLADLPAYDGPVGMVDALSRQVAPFVLFLDDFELITEPAVLGLVREIIDHLPRCGQIVLGSRSPPDLGLGRLRAAGQLLEIDTTHLRFSLTEAQQFFALRWPAKPTSKDAYSPASDLAAHLPTLWAKTEGWIAALWLASMALDAVAARQGSVADFIAQFSGSNRAVADFLAEDVLARQTPEIRDFLLRTSILRQLNAPLCQALMPRSDSRRLLDQLDAANLFITPLGDGPAGRSGQLDRAAQRGWTEQREWPEQRGWTEQRGGSGRREWPEQRGWPEHREWRYHSLFADFLRTQLAREQPDALARLHLAASGWYESQDRPVPAIDHAIEGGDMPHAITLLAAHAGSFLAQGRMRLLARWFAALPTALVRAQPMLQVVSLWACMLTRGPWDAMAQLHASGCADSPDPAVQAHVHALQPMLLAMMDRTDEASALGRAHLALGPSGQPFADSVLCNAMAHAMGVLGQRDEALRLLDAARRGQQGSGFNRMYSESVEGLLDLQQGRLRQATARFRLAVGMGNGIGMGNGHGLGEGITNVAGGITGAGGNTSMQGASLAASHGNAWAGVLYAGAVYETHQLALAEHLLNVYLPLARDVGLPDHMILSHVMRSRIAFLRGDVDATLHTLTELEYLGHHRQLPRVVASARLEQARVLMLQGQCDASAAALDRADDPAVWQRVAQWQLSAHDTDDLALGRLRWAAMFGSAAAATQAGRTAGQAAALAQAGQRQRRALKLRLLQALALQRAGDITAAVAGMASLLPMVQAEGFVRLLLDEGPAVGPLLRRTRAALQDTPGSRLDPLTADHLQRLIGLAGGDPASDGPALPNTPHEGPHERPHERQNGAAHGAPHNAPPEAGDTPPSGAPTALAEPLTRKEIRVLHLLAEGYSNGAMADKLFVSDSTVRTHLRNINFKLGARSRTQAVAMARRLGLMA